MEINHFIERCGCPKGFMELLNLCMQDLGSIVSQKSYMVLQSTLHTYVARKLSNVLSIH